MQISQKQISISFVFNYLFRFSKIQQISFIVKLPQHSPYVKFVLKLILVFQICLSIILFQQEQGYKRN